MVYKRFGLYMCYIDSCIHKFINGLVYASYIRLKKILYIYKMIRDEDYVAPSDEQFHAMFKRYCVYQPQVATYIRRLSDRDEVECTIAPHHLDEDQCVIQCHDAATSLRVHVPEPQDGPSSTKGVPPPTPRANNELLPPSSRGVSSCGVSSCAPLLEPTTPPHVPHDGDDDGGHHA